MSTELATLSIVIINYNYKAFLAQAIESALSQSAEVDSVIVVDDGSTDGSRELISAYGSRIVPVLKKSGGHVSAVNAGFEKVTSDLCIFLDADDVLFPDCAKMVREAFQDGDVKVQYRLETIDAAGVDQNMTFPYFARDISPETILEQSRTTSWYHWPVSSGNAFARSYLSKLLPIDESRVYQSPDGYLNKLAPLYGPVRTVHAPLGAYRVHGKNAWANTGEGWTPATAIRWLRFDRVLEASFRETAVRQGVQIADPIKPSLQQLEYRLLAFRFSPAESPYQSDSQLLLFPICVDTVRLSPNLSRVGRLIWVAWFTVLLYAPAGFVRWLFSRSRGQTGRTSLFRQLVNLSKGRSTRRATA